jgi:WD40 repeat protein
MFSLSVFHNKKGPDFDIVLYKKNNKVINCIDFYNDDLITGNSDGTLTLYNIKTGKEIREYNNKNQGNNNSISYCKIFNNKIISGCFDGKIYIWEIKGSLVKILNEHKKQISKIIIDKQNGIFMSSSYDLTIRIWNINSNYSIGKLIDIHKYPITNFNWINSFCFSSDKNGNIAFWDINTQNCFSNCKLHKGEITNIIFYEDIITKKNNLIITSGYDGFINVINLNNLKIIYSKCIYNGNISFISITINNFLITTGEKLIKVFDIQKNFIQIGEMKSTDKILKSDILGSILITGCQDGNLLCYNIDLMECIWGYCCVKKGGVKFCNIIKEKNKIITIGENNEGLILNFSN